MEKIKIIKETHHAPFFQHGENNTLMNGGVPQMHTYYGKTHNESTLSV